MSLCILLLEDDQELRATLRQALTVEGYRVLAAASLADAKAQWQNRPQGQSVDMALIDLGLPDGDGAQFLRYVRSQSQAPVLVISARHQDVEKVQLLDEGADDYLVKPFGVGELLARMRVAWRHRGRNTVAAITHYVNGPLVVDIARYRVSLAEREVHLTPREFSLLARLVRQAGQVVTHRQLLADVWGPEFTAHTHYLRLYMAQLRGKLEADPAQPRFLLTEPGLGYRLVDAPASA